VKLLADSVTAKLEWRPSDPIVLRSISGFRQMDTSRVLDIDGGNPSSAFFAFQEREQQYSEELQALYSSKLVTAALGAFYFYNNELIDPADVVASSSFVDGLCGGFCPPVQATPYFTDALSYRGHEKTQSEAAFGQIDLHATDKITVTAGLRFTTETKRFAQNTDGDFCNCVPLQEPYDNFSQYNAFPLGPYRRVSYDSTTPKFGLQYQVDPDILLYASYSKGFKAGGFELGVVAPPYRPEKLTDYEGGVKARLFDGKLTAYVAGFYYDYEDLQVQAQNGAFSETIVNAGKATNYGVEAEIQALVTNHIRLDLSGDAIHAVYDQYLGIDEDRPQLGNISFAGKYLSNAPKLTLQFGAEYFTHVWHGEIKLRGEMQYISTYYFTPINVDIESQPAFMKGNLFLSYDDDANWKVELFVRNIGNLITRESIQGPGAPFGSPESGSVSAPRLIGGELSYRF
jgi:iron complex outermembrane receptor protein